MFIYLDRLSIIKYYSGSIVKSKTLIFILVSVYELKIDYNRLFSFHFVEQYKKEFVKHHKITFNRLRKFKYEII